MFETQGLKVLFFVIGALVKVNNRNFSADVLALMLIAWGGEVAMNV